MIKPHTPREAEAPFEEDIPLFQSGLKQITGVYSFQDLLALASSSNLHAAERQQSLQLELMAFFLCWSLEQHAALIQIDYMMAMTDEAPGSSIIQDSCRDNPDGFSFDIGKFLPERYEILEGCTWYAIRYEITSLWSSCSWHVSNSR